MIVSEFYSFVLPVEQLGAMVVNIKSVLLIILLITANSVYCEEIYSSQYDQCMDASNGVTYEMKECMNSEFQYQDRKLNELYKKLMNSLSNDRKKNFVRSKNFGLRIQKKIVIFMMYQMVVA